MKVKKFAGLLFILFVEIELFECVDVLVISRSFSVILLRKQPKCAAPFSRTIQNSHYEMIFLESRNLSNFSSFPVVSRLCILAL